MRKNLQKSLLSATLILFSVIAVNAQWTSISPIYGGTLASDGAVGFSIGEKGYIVAGSSTADWYVYDTVGGSWTSMGAIPALMGHAFAMSFVINGKAYVVGGDTSGVPINTVWEFDPSAASNPWTRKNDFPGGARDAGFAFSLLGSGYAGAGFDGSGTFSDIWKYNVAGDSWTQLPASLPVNGLIFPSSFVIGNVGYILTGGTGTGVNETKQMWALDGYTDSLSAKSDFGGIARQSCFSFSFGSYGFVGGGQAGFATNYYDMWMYDAVNDQWSPSVTAPLLGAAWSSSFVIGNNAYVGLGAKFVGTGLTGDDNFYKFRMDVATGINNVNRDNARWSLYPNPASDVLHFTGMISDDATITVFDAMGRVVLERKNISNEKFLSISNLHAGIYTIQINEKSGISIRRFVKE